MLPTKLDTSKLLTISASSWLYYLVSKFSLCIPEDDVRTWRYYLLPCFFLFDRSNKVLKLVLDLIGSFLTDSNLSLPSDTSTRYATDNLSRINATISLLLLMYKDIKVQKIISLFRTEVSSILQSIASLQSSEVKMTLEGRHRFQCSFEQLKVVTSTSPAGWLSNELWALKKAFTPLRVWDRD